ncbi:MAG: HEPN domain-containing protein [Anaerolineae bacterium]
MKPETQEWVDKVEGDWKVAQREMGTADPVWNVVCFLAQQCAEKYLKAFLEEHSVAFQKTHDLVVLLNASGSLLPDLTSLRQQLAHLTIFDIAAHYPGAQADHRAAEEAVRTAEEVRAAVRTGLGLPWQGRIFAERVSDDYSASSSHPQTDTVLTISCMSNSLTSANTSAPSGPMMASP